MEMPQCHEVGFLSGTKGSKRDERMWKMTLGAECQQQAEQTKMLSVKEKVHRDHRLTVRMIADKLSMNSERVWRIITKDLGMRKICAKWYQGC